MLLLPGTLHRTVGLRKVLLVFLCCCFHGRPKNYVLNTLVPELEPHMRVGVRNTHISIHIKVLVALNFFAVGSYQNTIGKDFHLAVSQPMVSRILKEVVTVFTNHLLARYVKFPTTPAEIRQVKNGFLDNFQFPNIIGAIDCTHVAIISPHVNDPIHPAIAYYNRKGYYSINVQAICDSDLKFLAVNSRYPGPTHDAAIWQLSTVNRHLQNKYEDGNRNFLLIGDSGYPLQPWLMTPIPDAPENTPEYRYSESHCRARNVIERAFGVLKQRLRCLLKHRVLHYSHEMAGKIVYTCAVLHNICIANNFLPDVQENVEDEENNDDGNWLAEGRRIRNQIIQQTF